MTLKDTLQYYLSKDKSEGKAEEPASAPSTSTSEKPSNDGTPVEVGQTGPAASTAAVAQPEAHASSSKESLDVPLVSTSTMAAPAVSRSASTKGMVAKYKDRLASAVPSGQFDIENATALPLNISLNQVGPLYYDIVKPGEVFSRTTGKVWFTIEVRLHLGPASEYGKWSVAWPIMLVAGPSAAALSLAAIPLVVLATGTASISALVAAAVQGVTAAFSSAASALGIAQRLPFASKYRAKAIGSAKQQAAEAQKFAGQVMATLREKGGVAGMLEEWKKKGGEPKLVEFHEQPTSVHDITGADLAEVLDVKGPGPKGWKKKRWTTLKQALEECTLLDRGWFAGREPVLRVVGGPRIVQVENPFPKAQGEERTILEIYPLRLEKVVEAPDGTDPIVEEVARGEGKERSVQETVKEAAEAIRED